VALAVLAAWAHSAGPGFGGGQLGTFALAGAVGFGGGGLCMMHALPRLGSTFGLLVVECAAALTTALFAWWFFGAGLTGSQALGALLCLGGVFLALCPYRIPELPMRKLLAGTVFAASAAVLQGLSWTLSKGAFNALAAEGVAFNPLGAAYQRLLGGFLLASVVLLLGRTMLRGTAARGLPREHRQRRRAFAWVAGNALAGPVLGVSCMLWAIREVENPGLVQAVVATATLFSVPFARRLEGRVFRPQYFVGAPVALAGIAVLFLSVEGAP
jgi:drug/metabolite transporter (DMT)-like permease